ncbi:MAG: phosphodiester glycosidase family protein [Armatimonadetes bacterium]|nr:phosphodiester glycosidase family protein [Armatimonadota bacterium]
MTTFFVSALVLAAGQGDPDITSLRWVKELRPGVYYRQEIHFDRPLVIHSLKFRYPSDAVRFETMTAKDRIFAPAGTTTNRETVSSMAERAGAFAALNADFFGMDGDPLGLFISRGDLLSEPFPSRTTVAWADSALVFDEPSWSGSVTLPNGAELELDGINRAVRPGELILVTPRGGRVYSKPPAYMFVCETDSPADPLGETLLRFKYVVSETHNFEVPDGHLVIAAAKGRHRPFMNALVRNSDWKLRITLRGRANYSVITEAISGGPRLVRDGKPAVNPLRERFPPGFASAAHPRTALGVTEHRNVVLAVVDGRSSISGGVSLEELAKIMIRLGCVDAVNLDGGGSSTLYIAGSIINRPSGGLQRPVANALLLYLAPRPEADTGIRIVAKTAQLRPGDATTLKVKDENGQAVSNDGVFWICEGRAAWIDQGGKVRALSPGRVRIRALARGAEATLAIIVASGA